MEDWHQKLARDLVAHAPSASHEDHSTALEVAFGRARSATAYVLELARAHRVPASGGAVGDDIWVQLGDGRARFTLNRRAAQIAVCTGREERRLQWDVTRRLIVDAHGNPSDVEQIARAAIDALVDEWRSNPAAERLSSVPPQPGLEREDEPTKG
ncbi:MAG TPA: hypothetical protein VEK07_15020 [Polyangiaceae bacterium]|nr:hypothetical protein [Polyangiaceae bacterium]